MAPVRRELDKRRRSRSRASGNAKFESRAKPRAVLAKVMSESTTNRMGSMEMVRKALRGTSVRKTVIRPFHEQTARCDWSGLRANDVTRSTSRDANQSTSAEGQHAMVTKSAMLRALWREI
jgi:hypothetical protein